MRDVLEAVNFITLLSIIYTTIKTRFILLFKKLFEIKEKLPLWTSLMDKLWLFMRELLKISCPRFPGLVALRTIPHLTSSCQTLCPLRTSAPVLAKPSSPLHSKMKVLRSLDGSALGSALLWHFCSEVWSISSPLCSNGKISWVHLSTQPV